MVLVKPLGAPLKDSFGSVPPSHLRSDRPFRIGVMPPTVEWQVSEVVLPYAPLSVDWPVVIKAAAQAADRE